MADPDESDAPLLVERAPGLLRLRLNRPHRRNALNGVLHDALDEVTRALEDDTDTRVVLLEGAGPVFCAGADLHSGNVIRSGSDWPSRRRDEGAWQRTLERLDRLPQVTVAALHGAVVGGGVLLAAACDVRIAADDTILRIPELALGIPLTWGGVPLLVREVGLPLTRDWVLSGRPVAHDELLRSGFAQQVVPSARLHATVDEYVDSLLAISPPVLAMTRAMTSALDRAHPAMAAGWADADLLHWSIAEQLDALDDAGGRGAAGRAEPPADELP